MLIMIVSWSLSLFIPYRTSWRQEGWYHRLQQLLRAFELKWSTENNMKLYIKFIDNLLKYSGLFSFSFSLCCVTKICLFICFEFCKVFLKVLLPLFNNWTRNENASTQFTSEVQIHVIVSPHSSLINTDFDDKLILYEIDTWDPFRHLCFGIIDDIFGL